MESTHYNVRRCLCRLVHIALNERPREPGGTSGTWLVRSINTLALLLFRAIHITVVAGFSGAVNPHATREPPPPPPPHTHTYTHTEPPFWS